MNRLELPLRCKSIRQCAEGLAWTVILAFMVCACGDQPGEVRPDGAPIRFSYQNRIGSAIPIVAVEKGMFSRHGLYVVPSRFNSGPACAEALYTGAADIGTMGDATAVLALFRKAPLRLITSHASGEHRHRLIVDAEASIKSAADLIGKRIAIKKGTSTYGGFLKFLEAKNISTDRIRVVNLKPETMPDALAAGSIDAFAASEPTPSLGEMRGGREIATFGGLGNTYPVMMLATEKFIAGRADDLERFMAALKEAERFIADNREQAVKLVAESIGLPRDVTERAMERHEFRLNLDASTLNSLQETAEFLRSQGLIDSVPELNSVRTMH